MKSKKKVLKSMLVFILFGMVLCVNGITANAATSKKSVTFTLTKKNSNATYDVNATKGSKIHAKVKVISKSGKGKGKKICWGYMGHEVGVGSFFYNFKPSKLKKGKVFKSDDWLVGSGGFTFELPKGIKKIKLKVTLYSEDGSKAIKSIKRNNKFRY